MRRPTRGWALALVLLLPPGAALAQLSPLVPVPVPAVPVVPLGPIAPLQILPDTGKAITGTVNALPGTDTLIQTVTKAIGPTTQKGRGAAASATKPLRSKTSASTLLRAPLGMASSPRTAAAVPRTHLATPRSAAPPQQLDLALNRVVTPAVPPTPAGQSSLASARGMRLQALVHHNPQELDADDLGQPIIRGQILLLDADRASLHLLGRSGFRILDDERDSFLRLRITTVQAPPGLSTSEALKRVRAIATQVTTDYNHLFEPAGGALGPSKSAPARGGGSSGPLVGMIDGGVASHPALSGRIVEQKGFAGALKSTAHGTAVASLLVGRHGRFRGAASGARLLVADVYGGRSAAGSASAIARAMSWLSSRDPRVVNISLVGPRNELVRRAVAGLRARGIEVVAAVGNDGPAAPPQYPASYPGVTAVTAVDSRGVVLFEAGNAEGLDFAAPGADMAAARPGKGYVRVRGTSFAAPLAAGRLAQVKSARELAAEARPGKGRVGRGIICSSCRTEPRLVGAR